MKKTLSIFLWTIFCFALFAAPFSYNLFKDNYFNQQAAKVISKMVSSPEQKIEIHNIKNLFSGISEIDNITISDKDGTWAEISNVKVDWSLLNLIIKKVKVSSLEVEKIKVLRLPHTKTKSKKSSSSVTLDLQNIDINEIRLAKEILNNESIFSLKGKLYLSNKNYEILANAINTINNNEKINIAGFYHAKSDELNLKIDAVSPYNGALTKWLQPENPAPLTFKLNAEGSLSNLSASILSSSNNTPQLEATLLAQQTEENYDIGFKINSFSSLFIPNAYKNIISSPSYIEGQISYDNDKNININRFSVNATNANIIGNGKILADGFLSRLQLNLKLTGDNNKLVSIPFTEPAMRAKDIAISVDYGQKEKWEATVKVDELRNNLKQIADLDIKLWGDAVNLLEADKRQVTINAKATGKLLDKSKEKPLNIELKSLFSKQRGLEVNSFNVYSDGLKIAANGYFSGDNKMLGNADITASNLKWISFFLQEDISANLSLKTQLSGTYKKNAQFTLDANIEQLSSPYKSLNQLFADKSKLTSKIFYDNGTMAIKKLIVNNKDNKLNISGTISPKRTNLQYEGKLADINIFVPQASAPITFSGSAVGDSDIIDINTQIATSGGKLNDSHISNGKLKLITQAKRSDINFSKPNFSSKVNLSGEVDNLPLSAQGILKFSGKWLPEKIYNFQASLGDSFINANLTTDYKRYARGRIDISSPDITPVAKLFAVEGSGKIEANILLLNDNNSQNVNLNSKIHKLKWGSNHIDSLEANALVANIFKLPVVEGYAHVNNLSINETKIDTINLIAKTQRNITKFSFDAQLNEKEKITTQGDFNRLTSNSWSLKLTQLSSSLKILPLELIRPTDITFKNRDIIINSLALRALDGSINANGVLGDDLSFNLYAKNFPLWLVNYIDKYVKQSWSNNLGLDGKLTGFIELAGTKTNPDVKVDAVIDNFTSNLTEESGVRPFNIKLVGKSKENIIELEAQAKNNHSSFNVNGLIYNDLSNSKLALEIDNIPVKVMRLFTDNNLSKISGLVSGKATVNGKLKDPQVNFNLTGQYIKVEFIKLLRESALQVVTTGNYNNQFITLESTNVKNKEGMDIITSGTIHIPTKGLDLTAKGNLPLKLLESVVTEGTKINAIAKVNTKVNGTLKNPLLNGDFTIDNGSIFIPTFNISLKNITSYGSLIDESVIFTHITGQSTQGTGTVTAKGEVIINMDKKLPADLLFKLDKATYHPKSFFKTVIDGNLRISGTLLANPKFSGEVELDKTIITITDNFNTKQLLDVKHILPPSDVITTLKRAELLKRSKTNNSDDINSDFDIIINSPNPIMVTGKNIDVELNGNVHLLTSGTMGSFKMIKGKYEILGKPLIFTEGHISLTGNLTPELHFEYQESKADYLLKLVIAGTPDNIKIKLSSAPELPQEEILARLVFGKPLNELSGLQIFLIMAQLAKNQLNFLFLIDNIRNFIGVDDIRLITNENSVTGLTLSNKITENIYAEAEAKITSDSKLSLNIDINNNIKAKGTVDSKGRSSIGVFFEKDF